MQKSMLPVSCEQGFTLFINSTQSLISIRLIIPDWFPSTSLASEPFSGDSISSHYWDKKSKLLLTYHIISNPGHIYFSQQFLRCNQTNFLCKIHSLSKLKCATAYVMFYFNLTLIPYRCIIFLFAFCRNRICDGQFVSVCQQIIPCTEHRKNILREKQILKKQYLKRHGLLRNTLLVYSNTPLTFACPSVNLDNTIPSHAVLLNQYYTKYICKFSVQALLIQFTAPKSIHYVCLISMR